MIKKLYVLLPAFNEESSMRQLIKNLTQFLNAEKYSFEIVVCNDGSNDQTTQVLEELMQEYEFSVLTHKYNRGLGETARDLFEYAAEKAQPEDYIIRLDADNTHEPKFIKEMIKKIDEGYDVVTASRYQKGGGQKGVSPSRAFVSYSAQIFMKYVFGFKGLKEFSCGFRVYRASIIQKAIQVFGNNFIQLKGLGFTGTLEKLVKLKIVGAHFGEVGFQLRYDKKTSKSKMVTSITTLGYLTMALMYHWPWGGWKNGYKHLTKKSQ